MGTRVMIIRMNRLLFLLFVSTATLACQANDADEYAAKVKESERDYPLLLQQWRNAGRVRNQDSEDKLYEAARRSTHLEAIEEMAARKDVASIEIKVPGEVQAIKAQAVRRFDDPEQGEYRGNPFIFRRMTGKRFELWTSKHGWLFDSKGNLINEANPPRRDGHGREWYGAFLPDGSWVTTDLGDADSRLSFFTREGQLNREIKGAHLALSAEEVDADKDAGRYANIIGWCRCDKNGRGFVASVGSEDGWAKVFVTPDGKARPISWSEPWQLCYPRDLEAKGFFPLYRPSDDGKLWLYREEAGHGPGVGFPSFTTSSAAPKKDWFTAEQQRENIFSACIPGGTHDFGFLPGSHTAFIDADVNYDNGYSEPAPTAQKDRVPTKSWFFSPKGDCLGWVNAHYLCDSDRGKTLWFTNDDGDILQLSSDLKPKQRVAFTVNGEFAWPEKLFVDLRLGFFYVNKRLVLARW